MANAAIWTWKQYPFEGRIVPFFLVLSESDNVAFQPSSPRTATLFTRSAARKADSVLCGCALPTHPRRLRSGGRCLRGSSPSSLGLPRSWLAGWLAGWQSAVRRAGCA